MDSQPLCTVHQNLRKAFLDFFWVPSTFGYPQFKAKKDKKDTLYGVLPPIPHRSVHLPTDKGIQTPELHLIPASIHRKPLH